MERIYAPCTAPDHQQQTKPVVRNRTLTLIEREDATSSWGNFLVYFSLYHNAMPFKGLEIYTYRLLASQEYARC
jgi:hypothetical protein